MESLIALGYGWHDLEAESFRWTTDAFSIFILNNEVDRIIVELVCNKTDSNYEGEFSLDNWNTSTKLKFESGEDIISIKTKESFEIKFKTSFFIPNKLNNSSDYRTLGIQVFKFKAIFKNGSVYTIPIKDVKFRKDLFIESAYCLNKSIIHVSFGRGWHEMENNGQFRWSNGNGELFLNLKPYDELGIKFHSPNSQTITIKLDDNKELVYQILPGDSNICISNVKDVNKINIISPTFIPSKIDKKSLDDRILGIQIHGIQLIEKENLNIKDVSVKNIFNKNDIPALIDFSKKYDFSDKNFYEINGNGHVVLHNFDDNSNGKIFIDKQVVFFTHRSGWALAIDSIKHLNNKNGIKFEGFLEKNFSWDKVKNIKNENIPFKSPWVGVVHNPMTSPFNKKDIFSSEKLISSVLFKKSLETCKGLFTLTQDLKKKLGEYIPNIPIDTLYHPTEFPNKKFEYQYFEENKNKKVIQIGSWMRKYISFNFLNVNKDVWEKVRIISLSINLEKLNNFISLEKKVLSDENSVYNDDITNISFVNDEMYDELLSKNIVFVDFYDVSASNLVIECIARTTPILVSKHPAIIEYLGKEYPFYFESVEEASEKLNGLDLIKTTHEYLLTLETRNFITKEYFQQSFENSNIYKSL